MALRAKLNKTSFKVGDKVKVFHKIKEGENIRTQPFEGIVMGIKGKGINKSFVVRRIATGGVPVERIWPLACPSLEKIEVTKKGKVRRAKLNYLRKRTGKKATRIREDLREDKEIEEETEAEAEVENKDKKEKPEEKKEKDKEKTEKKQEKKPEKETKTSKKGKDKNPNEQEEKDKEKKKDREKKTKKEEEKKSKEEKKEESEKNKEK